MVQYLNAIHAIVPNCVKLYLIDPDVKQCSMMQVFPEKKLSWLSCHPSFAHRKYGKQNDNY